MESLPQKQEVLQKAVTRFNEIETELHKLECQRLKILADQDFFTFCTKVCGYDLLEGDPKNNPSRLICDALVANEDEEFIAIFTPRDSFKSTICNICYILWKLKNDPDERVLIWMETFSKSCAKLVEIKHHITGTNERSKFRDVYGDLTPPRGGRWSTEMIDIAGRTKGYAEPSIMAAGVETSLTGRHFSLILADDPCSDKNSLTYENRVRVKRQYRLLHPLLDRKKRRMIFVGTRWDDDDLGGEIIEKHASEYYTPWQGDKWKWDPKNKWSLRRS